MNWNYDYSSRQDVVIVTISFCKKILNDLVHSKTVIVQAM